MTLFDIFKSKPTGIPPERMPDHKIPPVTEPIEGYTLKYHYKDVEISSWEMIPRDVKIGNRIIFLQEPTTVSSASRRSAFSSLSAFKMPIM